MQSEMLDIKGLSTLLSMGPRSAREFCSRNGVLPINVGLKKRMRLRWIRSEVMQMLGTLEAKQKPAPKEFVPRIRGSKTVLGKSVDDLLKELAVIQ